MMSKRSKSLVDGIVLAAFLFLAVIGIVTFMPSVFAENHSHSSVTGYFGLDDDGLPIVDRHGIMLVFDGEIASETVSVDTFEVSVNDGSFAEIVETQVDGAYVFLKLEDELASDATPIVRIAEGEEVEDLAGNSTNRRKLGFVQIKDGIAPRLTVTLSGGSGIGTGDEGPDRLTKDMIDIRITSDEPLQGVPRVVVVCESLKWTESVDGRDVKRDIDDFIASRNGPFSQRPQEPPGTMYTCGYDADDDGMYDVFELTEDVANSRPGEVWELTWRNPVGSSASLRDGQLAVVLYGRDKSRYDRYGEDVSNWAVAMDGFGLDTQFESASVPNGVKVHPEDGSKTSEARPFVLIEFPETNSVTLNSVLFDGAEVSEGFQDLGDNRFVYWPMSISRGQHSVDVEARDSAGNNFEFDFSFESVERGDFVLELRSGWNAVSIPVAPIYTEISAVFSEKAVQVVVGWNEGRWSIAMRREGAWQHNTFFEPLARITEGYGYWVKASEFVHQRVALVGAYCVPGKGCRGGVGSPPAFPGWNFVGVLDRDIGQTEDHFGDALRDYNLERIFAQEYLGEYKVAFTWEATRDRFEPLLRNDPMMIGDGVWVYYDSSIEPRSFTPLADRPQ